LALNCGNTLRAAAQTFSAMAVTVILPPASSALGAKRARNSSSSVVSARSCCVTWGIVFQHSARCSAVLRRTPRIDKRSFLSHLAQAWRKPVIALSADRESAPALPFFPPPELPPGMQGGLRAVRKRVPRAWVRRQLRLLTSLHPRG